MAANSPLTKGWIQYLKNNQIVDMKSDPNTGALSYRRNVTADDLHEYLALKTDYTPEQISNAIHMVLSKKAIGQENPKVQNNPTPSKDVSTWHHSEMRPGAFPPKKMPSNTKALPNETPSTNPQQTPQLGHEKHPGVTDIDYKDVPEQPPAKKKWWQRRGVKEDIRDEEGYVLDEQDVEQVFKILDKTPKEEPEGADGASGGKAAPVSQGAQSPQARSPQDHQADLNKLKRLVRDHMSDSQRKAFWRALNDA